MFNKLTEQAETLTGNNPLDIRTSNDYYIFDCTNDEEIRKRLQFRIGDDKIKGNVEDINTIPFFPTGSVNIGLIAQDTEEIEKYIDAFDEKGRKYHQANGHFFSHCCVLTIFLIQQGSEEDVIDEGNRVAKLVNDKLFQSIFLPTINMVGIRRIEDIPISKSVDEIMFWLINTRQYPMYFKDMNGTMHTHFFIQDRPAFVLIKVTINNYTEYVILNTLYEEFKQSQTDIINFELDNERLRIQKERYFGEIGVQEDKINEQIKECVSYVPILYKLEEIKETTYEKIWFFLKSKKEKSTYHLKLNKDDKKLKKMIAKDVLNKIPPKQLCSYIFNTLRAVYTHTETLDDVQWNQLFEYVQNCIAEFFLTSDYIKDEYLNNLDQCEVEEAYKEFVEKYNAFSEKISKQLRYWSSIHSSADTTLLMGNRRFLSSKLEYDNPDNEFINAINKIKEEDLPPVPGKLATDEFRFYDALPSENAGVNMSGKEFYVMKYVIGD